MSMPLADLIFLAFALSVDAFVVAFSYGLLIKQKRLSNGIKLSLSTGAGQFLMPVLGFLLTGSVHRYIAAWDHWLGFAVFTFLGVNVLREGWNHRNEEEDMPHVTSLTLPTLMAVGIATSIDALVAGVSIYLSSAQCGTDPTLHAVLLPAAAIGFTTFRQIVTPCKEGTAQRVSVAIIGPSSKANPPIPVEANTFTPGEIVGVHVDVTLGNVAVGGLLHVNPFA